MLYRSTRGGEKGISSSEAMLKGISSDGGLYVPDNIYFNNIKFEDLVSMDYKELACFILEKYFTDFGKEELLECIHKAYDCKFDDKDIVPLIERCGVYFMELYHGPTLAFKDMALTILPHLLKKAVSKINLKKDLVILTATSGDTGKAALEAFANVEGTKIIVFFPQNGVSEIQKLQMITQEGSNTRVIGIEGNFDDAQNGVKNILNNSDFVEKLDKSSYMLSSANSINIGRLIPQVVYYIYGYLNLLKNNKIEIGEKINVVVPTGNFGNILAAYYAKKMGLPIGRLICASNENNVLYDFINKGIYNKKRELKLTNSPSMDIVVSSNLERLLYEISGRDEGIINGLMKKLEMEGEYEITEAMIRELRDFYGEYASEEETSEAIGKVYKNSGYIMDTHTAVAYSVYEKYLVKTRDDTKTIIASTASPFKFAATVCSSIDIDIKGFNDFEVIKRLSKAAEIKIPSAIKILKSKSVIHRNICRKNDMKLAVEKFLGM